LQTRPLLRAAAASGNPDFRPFSSLAGFAARFNREREPREPPPRPGSVDRSVAVEELSLIFANFQLAWPG
jgi:hypothetical protein